jgi:hypothetical protein
MTTLQGGATARAVRPTGHAPRPRDRTNPGAGAIATGAAVVVYFVATGIELLLIRTLLPTEVELAWISDAILAFAFGSAVFLWLHLKWTRMTLSRLERERIVLDAQLSLAADIQRGLLPPTPPDDSGVRWAARLVQAGRIGGDLYDFVRLDSNAWLVLVGDTSGKGVPERWLLLPLGSLIAVVWANAAAESYFKFAERLAFPVNEIGMAFFLALVTHEIVEALVPGGALHTWRRWGMSLAAAAGGIAGTAFVYLAYVYLSYEDAVALIPIVPLLPHEPRRLDIFADPPDDDAVHHAGIVGTRPLRSCSFCSGW